MNYVSIILNTTLLFLTSVAFADQPARSSSARICTNEEVTKIAERLRTLTINQYLPESYRQRISSFEQAYSGLGQKDEVSDGVALESMLKEGQSLAESLEKAVNTIEAELNYVRPDGCKIDTAKVENRRISEGVTRFEGFIATYRKDLESLKNKTEQLLAAWNNRKSKEN